MARQVEIASGRRAVALPNGNVYSEGDVVVLTDAEWNRVNPNAIGTTILDRGALADPDVDASFATDADLAGHANAADPHPVYATDTDLSGHASDLETHGLGGPSVTVEEVAGAAYTVVEADDGKVKRFMGTDTVTVSLPDGVPVGTMVSLLAVGAGGLVVQAGGTATVVGGGTVAQDKEASCLCDAVDHWNVQGAA